MGRRIGGRMGRRMRDRMGRRMGAPHGQRLEVELAWLDDVEVDEAEVPGRKALDLLVGAQGEEPGRLVPVIPGRALVAVAPVDAQVKPPAWTQHRADRGQHPGQVRVWHVQQAVQGVDRVERPGREVQMQEVHHVGVEALLPAEADHGRGQVGRDHLQAVAGEEGAVVARARTDLQ